MNGTDARAAGVLPSASTAAASLAPGFRFHPTDEELVSYYLKRKVAGRPLHVDAIAEVDLYRREPWELPGLSRIRSRDMEWYFFSPLDRKHSNRGRTNRATAEGYWKTTGKDRSVRHGSRVVGMKKTLVFHSGRAPRGVRTNWVMHEYRLGGDDPREAAVPQDPYAVCRIFHKNGAGPQNGAQYGAPFIEEEWENDASGQLAMMNEVGEDDFVDAGEPEYLQHNDFQNQNPEGQHANPLVLQAGPVGHDGGDNADDTSALLDEMLKEPSLINDIVSSVDESDHLIPIRDFKREPYMEDSSHLVQTDEFLELDDLSDILFARNLSGEDSMNHSLRNFHDENYQDGVADGSNFENIHRDDGSMNTVHQRPDKKPETLQMRSVENNIIMNSDGSYQYLEDVNTFYDAPGDRLAFVHSDFVQLNELYHSPVSEQPAFDVPDDLLAYFDATDVNLQYDLTNFTEEPEIYDSIMAQSNLYNEVSGAIVTPGAPSSASDDHFMNKCESFDAESDLQANQGKDLTIAKRLINMLGSIAAPPAYATEIPSIPGKCVEESFENGSTNSLCVTAEAIHIQGLRVSGNAEHWSLQKNGNMGYLLSYNVKDASKITAGSQSFKKPYCRAISGVLRGGFCLFFLSAAILGISYKVGHCIYGR